MSNFDSRKARAAVTFARETWRNDGAEGETVHVLASAVEHLLVALEREEKWSKELGDKLHTANGKLGNLNARVTIAGHAVDASRPFAVVHRDECKTCCQAGEKCAVLVLRDEIARFDRAEGRAPTHPIGGGEGR